MSDINATRLPFIWVFGIPGDDIGTVLTRGENLC
uniref:Cyclopeptide FIWVFGIP n=1 Tax=Amanita exitialis TaxID=262245 RepID=A0A6G9EN07_AMAEX|nr:cyclopeptide FIWVFGIP [Amanita exitialis]